MQKIIPFLWFDTNAEEAVNFYVSIFKKSKINQVTRYTKETAEVSKMSEGTVMTIIFNLEGQEFIALNGGSMFKFSEAISFFIPCKNQKEIDWFWEKLTDGGKEGQCGWLKDKYGVSWQVAPIVLDKMLNDKNLEKANKVMLSMIRMKKIDIKILKQAYNSV